MANSISLQEQIRIATNILEDNNYNLKVAKSPKSKRVFKNTIEFWESIHASLKELETLRNDSSGKIS